MRLGDNVSKLQSDGADTIRRKRCCHQFNHEGDSIKEVLLRWYVNPMLGFTILTASISSATKIANVSL
jgi:hypothetical protein